VVAGEIKKGIEVTLLGAVVIIARFDGDKAQSFQFGQGTGH
jgi:hypothetical protein